MIELWSLHRRLGVVTIYNLNPYESEVLFTFIRRAHLARNHVTLSQTESSYLALGDVDVFVAISSTGRSKETVSIAEYIDDSSTH